MHISRGEFIRRLSITGSALVNAGVNPSRRDYIREAKCLVTGRLPNDRGNERPSVTRMLRVDQNYPGCFGVGHNSVQIPHDGNLTELEKEAA